MRIQSQERVWTSELQQSGASGTHAVKTAQTTASTKASGATRNLDGDTVELSSQALAISRSQSSTVTGVTDAGQAAQSVSGTSASGVDGGSKPAGGAAPAQSSAATSDTSEEEIEKLQTEKEELEKQLAKIRQDKTAQQDSNQIALIENKIRTLDAQIQQLQSSSSSSWTEPRQAGPPTRQ